jgi:hypothetical protein
MVRALLRYGVVTGALCTLLVAPAGAQTPAGSPIPDVTRAQLVAKARSADSLGRHEEAFLLRTRLRDGDFDVGDQIIFVMEGGAVTGGYKRDSLVVQTGRQVKLGEPLGNLDLTGVLRFEVDSVLRARVGKYYKNVVVSATPLIRLAVSGTGAHAGFYHFPPDIPLSDIVMKTAGGGTQPADLHDISIKRGEKVLWAGPDITTALADGMTIDKLGLESGDEIVIGAQGTRGWTTVLQYAIPLVTAIVISQIYSATRRR